jgi:hypothetical protein
MEAIARRAIFALFFAGTEDDIRNILASMATDLSAGNISGFLKSTAKTLAARDELRQQLVGLTSAYDINSSVQVQTSSGGADQQSAKVDWYLSGRSRSDNAISFQRREVLSIEFSRVNKRWLVTSIEPRAFFSS